MCSSDLTMASEVLVPVIEVQGAKEEAAANNRATWQGSNVTETQLDWLQKSRRIPPGVACRIPTPEKISPQPNPGEYVVFLAHFHRGFGLPSSDFLRAFLRKFNLQPRHLPANAFVYLSSFASFFEGYLGLWPSLHH